MGEIIMFGISWGYLVVAALAGIYGVWKLFSD